MPFFITRYNLAKIAVVMIIISITTLFCKINYNFLLHFYFSIRFYLFLLRLPLGRDTLQTVISLNTNFEKR